MSISFHHRWTRIGIVLLVAIVALLAATRSAQAQGIIGGNVIPAGTVFENDAFLNGGDIVLDGTVVGDVLAVGRTVTVNGDVEGSLVALAETVVVNGAVDGSVYSGALNFELSDSAVISRSTYFAGARLVTDPDSLIGSDLVAGTLGAQLQGSVGRDVKATIGLLAIVNRVMEGLDINPNWSIFSSLGSSDAPEAGDSAAATGALVPTGFALSELAKSVQPAGGQLVYLAGQNLAAQDEDLERAVGQNKTVAWLFGEFAAVDPIPDRRRAGSLDRAGEVLSLE